MGSNPRDVAGGEIVGRLEGWSRPSTPRMFKCCERFGECIIRLRYAFFLIAIDFGRVGST